MDKKTGFSLLIGIIISAAALVLAFRNVPLSELLTYLGSINYWWVIPSVILVLISFALRAIRWQIILRSSHRIGFWPAYHPLMIAFMMNCVLPGRVGELARPVILHRREQVPFTTGLATVAAERLFDVVMLMTFFVLVLTMVDIDPAVNLEFGRYHLNRDTLITIGKGMLQLGLALIAGIVVVSMERSRRTINHLILTLPNRLGFLGDRTADRIERWICLPSVRIVENIAAGFSTVKKPERIAACLALSAAIWALQGVSYYVVSWGSPGIQLSFMELFAVLIIVCFFIALPSVPGFWGIWEAGGVFAMSLFGVAAKEAAGFTLANHAVQMFPVIFAGIISALVTGISIRQLQRHPTHPADTDSG